MPVRVAIVGALGNLGSRLAIALSQDPAFNLAVGVVQPDDNLIRALSALETNPELKSIIWAEEMFMAERHQKVRNWNARQSLIKFKPVDQLSLKNSCDVVIDVTNYGSRELMRQYLDFKCPVILQSGAKIGNLISPPLVLPSADGIYRQGDCLVSALIPVLSAFNGLTSIRMHLIKQYGEQLGDYPTYQRLNATYLCPDVVKYLMRELSQLLPEVRLEVEGVYQIPGLIYYTATLILELDQAISGADLRNKLGSQPRLKVVGDQITSTYDIDYYLQARLQMAGSSLPPIIVYGSTLKPGKDEVAKRVYLQLAIYYKLIAVLPNIDALRILCLGEDPQTAMRRTDELAHQLPI